MSMSHSHQSSHHYYRKPASHSVSHVYVSDPSTIRYMNKYKEIVEAVLLDEEKAKKAEEEHLAEDLRQAELARLAIEAAQAAEDAKAAEELEREEAERAEETKAVIANARKSMRWPPVGARFASSGPVQQERIVLRHVNDIDPETGTVLNRHTSEQTEQIMESTRKGKEVPQVALRRVSATSVTGVV